MRSYPVIAATLLLVACGEGPVTPDVAEPVFQISDAVHSGGNKHFFWLPPMVPAAAPNGSFDGSLSPVVTVCEWDGTACVVPLLAEYTMTSGPGSETLRVEPEDELYVVNWHTDEFALDAQITYRVSVLVAGTELGHADLDVVSGGKDLKNVDTGHFVALMNGRTLPIKFRVEEGAVFVVGDAGATFDAENGAVRLDVPAGAVASDVGITIAPVEDLPDGQSLIPGAVFDFQPDGTAFSTPALLTLAYDEANLGTLPEESLTILTEEDGVWVELESTVDAAANQVTAEIDGFSAKGIGSRVTTVEVSPAAAELSPMETVQLEATPRNAADDPVDRPIRWTSSDPGVATVDEAGLVTAVAPGTASIEAGSGSAVGTSEIAVAGSILYDESVNPDLNGDQSNPTPIGTLELGVNQVVGTHSLVETGSGQGDSYTVTLPAGMEIVSAELVVGNFDDFGGITSTLADVFVAGPFDVLQGVSGITTSQTITFDGIGPLAGGTEYGFSLQYSVVEPGASPSYDWAWRIETQVSRTVLYDESVSPDLNGDQRNPTPVGTLGLGVNEIAGTHSLVETGSGQGDSYTVTLPAGMEIVSAELMVRNFDDFGGITFTSADVFVTGPFDVLQGVSGITTSQTITFDGIGTPSGGTDYGFSLQYSVVEPGASPSYRWLWRIETRESGTVLYDESVSPDLNGDQGDPTPIGALGLGVNEVAGTHSRFETGSGQGDSYVVSLPSGFEIVSVELFVRTFSGFGGATFTTANVFTPSPFDVLQEVSSIAAPETIVFDAVVPLAGGADYGFSLQYSVVEPGASPAYDWLWRIVTQAAGS